MMNKLVYWYIIVIYFSYNEYLKINCFEDMAVSDEVAHRSIQYIDSI